MSRLQVFTLAGVCALAATAVIGAAGLASSLEVVDTAGVSTSQQGVSTVERPRASSESEVAGTVAAERHATPDMPLGQPPVLPEPEVEDADDQESSPEPEVPVTEDPVAEVPPPPPVVLPRPGDGSEPHRGGRFGDRSQDRGGYGGAWGGAHSGEKKDPGRTWHQADRRGPGPGGHGDRGHGSGHGGGRR